MAGFHVEFHERRPFSATKNAIVRVFVGGWVTVALFKGSWLKRLKEMLWAGECKP